MPFYFLNILLQSCLMQVSFQTYHISFCQYEIIYYVTYDVIDIFLRHKNNNIEVNSIFALINSSKHIFGDMIPTYFENMNDASPISRSSPGFEAQGFGVD